MRPAGRACLAVFDQSAGLAELAGFFGRSPVVVRGGVSHWPAYSRWRDPEYLKQRAVG